MAAFAWIRAQPADGDRSAAIESAVETWMRRDPEPAEEWFEMARRTPLHDPGLEAIATELVQKSPHQALEWADRIQDESLRVATLVEVAAMWGGRSPEEVRTLLRTPSLPAETRREMRVATQGRRATRSQRDDHDWAAPHREAPERFEFSRSDVV